jgi:hypothetical protein
MPKALQPVGDMTLDDIVNSLTRKAMRGDIQVDEVIYLNRTGEGILPDGRHAISRIRAAFKVDILKDIEHVEVKEPR